MKKKVLSLLLAVCLIEACCRWLRQLPRHRWKILQQ